MTAPIPAPTVSVIIPTHNRADLLLRSIQSVLAQTWRDLELIVVDDASTDHTQQVLASITDPRLRHIRHEQSRHASGARNSGLRAARGQFIAFQDDDDIWLAQKLEKQINALRAAPDNVGVSICGHICYTRGRVFYVGGHDWFRRIHYRVFQLRDSALLATPGWVVRKRDLDRAGLFDESLTTWEDWELLLRLAQVCEFMHVDEPLFVQDRVQGGGLSRYENLYAISMRTMLEKHGALWQDTPVTLARHCLIVGRFEARYGSAREARHWLRRALRLKPWLPDAWGLYLLSLLGDGQAQHVRELWHQFRGVFKPRPRSGSPTTPR
jgi:glycosyltransferase involved in cell wall biosynthesis